MSDNVAMFTALDARKSNISHVTFLNYDKLWAMTEPKGAGRGSRPSDTVHAGGNRKEDETKTEK